MTSQRNLAMRFLLMLLWLAACSREPELPPLPKVERLVFEGVAPEGFKMRGIAILRAARKDRECRGTRSYILNEVLGGDWRHYYPRRVLEGTSEHLPGNQYRVTFPLQGKELGGSCRWQLVSVAIIADWDGMEQGMEVYSSRDREIDPDTQLWLGPREVPKPLRITCLGAETGKIYAVCEDQVPGDRGIPGFEGTLTIPLDVVVPGGLKAAHTRMQREKALEPERITAEEAGALAATKRMDLESLAMGDRQLDASAAAALRTQLEAEIAAAESKYRELTKAYKEKLAAIAADWERERLPDPLLDKAAPATDAPASAAPGAPANDPPVEATPKPTSTP